MDSHWDTVHLFFLFVGAEGGGARAGRGGGICRFRVHRVHLGCREYGEPAYVTVHE